MEHLWFVVVLTCVSHAFASVNCCLVVTCWERAELFALFFLLFIVFYCFFPMWYPRAGVKLNCIVS